VLTFSDNVTISMPVIRSISTTSSQKSWGNPHEPSMFCPDGAQVFTPFRLTSWAHDRLGEERRCNLCSLYRPIGSSQIALTFNFLEPQDNPLKWNMFLHPFNKDKIVSGSFYTNAGNSGFESAHKPAFYAALRRNRRPKDPVILDIGANIGKWDLHIFQTSKVLGIHSLFFAALGVRTHSFEPMPVNFAVLSCSVDANPSFEKLVTLHNYGLGAQPSRSCMVCNHDFSKKKIYD
jgi:hypothetical protein